MRFKYNWKKEAKRIDKELDLANVLLRHAGHIEQYKDSLITAQAELLSTQEELIGKLREELRS